MAQANRTSQNIAGAPVAIDVTSLNLRSAIGGPSPNHGPVVGSGSAPVTISDYDLDTPIADGAGAGQLSHGEESVGDVIITGNVAALVFSRPFTNNSGGNVTIAEIGWEGNLGSLNIGLFARDLLPSPLTLQPLQVFTLSLTLTISL